MPITGDATVITIRALSITDPVYSIIGQIVDDADDGLDGVLVTLSGDASDTYTTGAPARSGYYVFTGLSNGDYVVTPTKTGYTFVADHEDVTIAYDNEIVDDMAGILAVIWNAEGQTIGQQLNNVTSATGDAIRAVDYGTLPVMSPTNFSNCWWGETPASTTYVEVRCDLGAGEGVVPSGDETVKIECVFCVGDSTSGFSIYLDDLVSSPQERIRWNIDNTNIQFLTYHEASGSSLYTVAHGITFGATPSWMYFQGSFNFATNVATVRLVELDGAPQDSGLKTSGALSPTCGQGTELKVLHTTFYSTNNNVDQGISQIWFSKSGHTFPSGAAKTSNFVPA